MQTELQTDICIPTLKAPNINGGSKKHLAYW